MIRVSPSGVGFDPTNILYFKINHYSYGSNPELNIWINGNGKVNSFSLNKTEDVAWFAAVMYEAKVMDTHSVNRLMAAWELEMRKFQGSLEQEEDCGCSERK